MMVLKLQRTYELTGGDNYKYIFLGPTTNLDIFAWSWESAFNTVAQRALFGNIGFTGLSVITRQLGGCKEERSCKCVHFTCFIK